MIIAEPFWKDYTKKKGLELGVYTLSPAYNHVNYANWSLETYSMIADKVIKCNPDIFIVDFADEI